jgi:hypothetical protein
VGLQNAQPRCSGVLRVVFTLKIAFFFFWLHNDLMWEITFYVELAYFAKHFRKKEVSG